MRPNPFAPLPLLAMLFLPAVGLPAHAACTAGNPNANLIESTPTSDFTDHGNGTVTHAKTGLMWKQCPEGMSGAGCPASGVPTMTWANALKAANTANTAAFAGYTDWRLPNKKELESIVEFCGYQPAINQTAFPNTFSSFFWSGSSLVQSPSSAWAVLFTSGDTLANAKTDTFTLVRLVRGGQPVDSFDLLGTLPDAPTIGTATAGNASISVAFTPGALGSGTLINYTADCGGVTNTGGSSPITVAGLANGTSYTCRVKTTSTQGDSPWSAFSNSVTPSGGTLPARFIPVTPCRMVDTRSPGVYPISGGGMTTGESRSFALPSSACGIPSNALAYSLNATVVPNGPLGFLTMWPTGQSQPLVSTLNSPDGRTKANAAIVPAGTGGAVSAFVTNSTDLILDIDGYFVAAGSGGDLAFYPLSPCRLSDTRFPPGTNGGPTMGAGETRTLSTWNLCGIPSGAPALSLNYTVVPQGPLGFLTTWPAGQAQPLVSTLNAPTGTVVANAAIVPTGIGGQINVFVTNTTDVIVDVDGYFAPAGSPGALSFFAATPCRVSDTRNPVGPFGGPQMAGGSTRSYAVPGSACGIPSSAQAYSLNATVVPSGLLGYLTLWPTGISQPLVSTLNAWDGAVSSNAALVPAGTAGGINAFATNSTDLILDINGYFAP